MTEKLVCNCNDGGTAPCPVCCPEDGPTPDEQALFRVEAEHRGCEVVYAAPQNPSAKPAEGVKDAWSSDDLSRTTVQAVYAIWKELRYKGHGNRTSVLAAEKVLIGAINEATAALQQEVERFRKAYNGAFERAESVAASLVEMREALRKHVGLGLTFAEANRILTATSPQADAMPDDREQCSKCRRHYPCWFAPNDVWNQLVPGRVGMFCPQCFMDLDPKVVWIVAVAEAKVYQTSSDVQTDAIKARWQAEGLEEAATVMRKRARCTDTAEVSDWLRSRAAQLRAEEGIK